MTRKRAVVSTEADAIGNPATGESSREIWQRWSREREARERVAKLAAEAEAKAYTEAAIWQIEIARMIARDHAPAICPEWRYLRPLVAREFGRILKEQPEMKLRDVRGREKIILAVLNALPAHMVEAISELRAATELYCMAREATAFLVGWECGRAAGHHLALRDPRVMLAQEPQRRALPAHGDEPIRLTLG